MTTFSRSEVRAAIAEVTPEPAWLTPRLFPETDGPEVVDFAQTFCRLLKGPNAGEAPRMRGFQRDILGDLFERRPDGRRRYRRGLLGLPRKNTKSYIGSVLALFGLIADGEHGAEVYSVAGTRRQAHIVFDEARKMVRADPALSEAEAEGKIKVYRDAIEFIPTGSVYRVLSAEAGANEGLNPSLVVFDEVHVQPDWSLWDVMTLGSGTRTHPLTLGITTAGWDLESLCAELYEYGKSVASGEVEDEAFYFRWYEPSDPEVDHGDPRAWAECNPALAEGILDYEDFITAYNGTRENAFRRYRLNQWTSTEDAWIAPDVWAGRSDPERTIEEKPIVLGFDGAWSGDCTALVASTIEEHPHISVLGLWERPAGVDDWRVPVTEIEAALREAMDTRRVRELAMDPFRWERTMHVLAEEGYPVVEFRTNSLPRMVPACQSFEDAVLDGALTHDGSPSLARHVNNARTKSDDKGTRIVKENRASSRHLDLAVAAIVAHARAVTYEDAGEPTVYDLEDFLEDDDEFF